MEELVVYIREAVDRKQENMRRRRRRDALRLQLVRVLEKIAEYGTFGVSSCVVDRDSMTLHPTFVEYIDGARLYLETEIEKDNASIREVKVHFCNFIRKMIKNFSCKYVHSSTFSNPSFNKVAIFLYSNRHESYLVELTLNKMSKLIMVTPDYVVYKQYSTNIID